MVDSIELLLKKGADPNALSEVSGDDPNLLTCVGNEAHRISIEKPSTRYCQHPD